jgi:hypothetical protein
MKVARQLLKYWWLVLLVLLVGASYSYAHVAYFTLVDYSSFKEIQENVYVSEKIPLDEHQDILNLVRMSRSRISNFYGEPKAKPTIIIAKDADEAKDYGLWGVGCMYYVPWGAYVIFNNQERSIDIWSHELVHAEVFEHLGYYRRSQFPTWFDEGLAMQVDSRPRYSLAVGEFSKADLLKVQELDSPSKFFSKKMTDNERRKNYQTAKAALRLYFESHSPKLLYGKLKNFRDGASFDDIFQLQSQA